MDDNTNQNLIIAGVVIVILAIGWWIFYSGSNTTLQSTSQNNSTTTNTAQSANTLKTILAQKGSYECRYEEATSSGRSTNLLYIADGKMRGEFRTTGAVGNLMLYDGANLYVWKEGASVGTKTALKSVADLATVIPNDLTSGAVFGSGLNNVSWDCFQWSKNASLLSVPSQVTFTAK